MSKYINVCTTTYYPVQMSEPRETRDIIKNIKQYWKDKLEYIMVEKPDLILLPEQCDRINGSSPEEQYKYTYEKNEIMLDFFKDIAKQNECYIGYSSGRVDGKGKQYNSTQLINRYGKISGVYDKNFPTKGEMIEKHTLPGKESAIVECDFGNVGLVICWDLNFDELREQYKKASPDIILFSSMFHGGFKSMFWAYECQSYFIGAIGGYGQRSYILDPTGTLISNTTEYSGIITQNINLDYCVIQNSENRSKYIEAKKRYRDKINICIPAGLGAVLLTSETDEFTAKEIVEEYEMLSFPEILDETRETRNNIFSREKHLI